MTGELTLSGKVLPIGGLKEKTLAAHRGEIFNIILPKDNEKDIPDIPENIRKGMTFHPVKDMDEVIEKVFGSKFKRGRKPTAKTKSRKTPVTPHPSTTTLN
jgi:ATP-dependent Lon protease